jgi:hypothetical protein
MAWENCVDNIRATLDKNAKEVKEVDWHSITEDQLNNDTFRSGVPYILICPDRHCVDYSDFSVQAHRICNCQNIDGSTIPNCTPKDNLFPYPSNICLNINDLSKYSSKASRACINQGDGYYPLTCHCCCSCFAYGTKIGVPNGTKKIEQFLIGDQVLAADVILSTDMPKLNWSAIDVSFSSGTGPDGHQSAMIFIHHGDSTQTIVTPDHIFLLSTGKLKRADRLVPGQDFLVSEEGKAVPINEISVGEYEGGVHHIATERNFDGSINGHMLLSDGVVSCDFELQIHADVLKQEGYFADDHDSLPKVGSEAYEDRMGDHMLKTGTFKSYRHGTNAAAVTNRKFFVYGERATYLPQRTTAFLTPVQADDVAKNGNMRDYTETNLGSAAVKYLISLYSGFYQDMLFYCDFSRTEPNAYAFTQFKKDIVIITGGLTRIKDLGMEGIAIIIAHMITCLQRSKPLDHNGFTSVAMADYYSILPVQTVFFQKMYSDTYTKGMEQIDKFIFKYISPENDIYAGDPYAPSTKTRMEALKTGFQMGYPPEGIGGPVFEGLQLLSAEAKAPKFSAESFATPDIDEKLSAVIWNDLVDNGLLDQEGVKLKSVSPETDLSFLFREPSPSHDFMTQEVRAILMHNPVEIYLKFNLPLSAAGAALSSYALTGGAKVSAVRVDDKDAANVCLLAAIKDAVDYTVTISRYLMSDNGSTLDPDKNSAVFHITYLKA